MRHDDGQTMADFGVSTLEVVRRRIEKQWRTNLHTKSGAHGACEAQPGISGDVAQFFYTFQNHDVHIGTGEFFIKTEMDGRGTENGQRLIVAGHRLMHGGKE